MCICTLYVKNKNFCHTDIPPKSNLYSQIYHYYCNTYAGITVLCAQVQGDKYIYNIKTLLLGH